MSDSPEIVALEADFLVVAKPPGLLSHPTRPDGAPTLLGWLQEKFPGEFVALVNRLDRETSGTILAARSPEAASKFGSMTMRREIGKEYLALVAGHVGQEHGMIEVPLGRLGISESNAIWVRQGVIEEGDPRKSARACTEFWRVEASEAATLLRLQAHTGRMHQLRAHLAHIGHPVLGDKIYGPDPALYLKLIESGWTAEHEEKLALRRHALHAWRMTFCWGKEDREFVVAMPEDMQELAATLGMAVDGGSTQW